MSSRDLPIISVLAKPNIFSAPLFHPKIVPSLLEIIIASLADCVTERKRSSLARRVSSASLRSVIS
ncbi:MAG: hypothetical protein GW805_04775 [Ignavibacteria bacterium]|nr:hypothetical protein [Ignavibacteria bacterium]